MSCFKKKHQCIKIQYIAITTEIPKPAKLTKKIRWQMVFSLYVSRAKHCFIVITLPKHTRVLTVKSPFTDMTPLTVEGAGKSTRFRHPVIQTDKSGKRWYHCEPGTHPSPHGRFPYKSNRDALRILFSKKALKGTKIFFCGPPPVTFTPN